MDAFRPCILVPTYDNPRTIRDVVVAVRALCPHVVVVDDASGSENQAAVEALGKEGLAITTRRAKNGGKGAAVKTGFELARQHGFTHALQVDADGQHALDDIARFLEIGASRPDACVLGQPIFDETAPTHRMFLRRVTIFWTRREVGDDRVGDPLCGFRLYPIEAALATRTPGDRMDFDPEIVVRLAWADVPFVHVPTKVRYFTTAEGGVSHWRAFEDNWLIAKMHTRLMWRRSMHLFLRRPLVLPG
ncbi:MAG: glycosyltransferase family 2 protein [Deltaproteobacteria bacterium]|nr:glycosyltransferase family 2 protein [Deltaproteobacteria bacterium]